MLQRLPEDTAELCRKENRGRMTLTSGSAGYERGCVGSGAPSPNPILPFPEDTVKVSGVPAMAQHTVFATAQDQEQAAAALREPDVHQHGPARGREQRDAAS